MHTTHQPLHTLWLVVLALIMCHTLSFGSCAAATPSNTCWIARDQLYTTQLSQHIVCTTGGLVSVRRVHGAAIYRLWSSHKEDSRFFAVDVGVVLNGDSLFLAGRHTHATTSHYCRSLVWCETCLSSTLRQMPTEAEQHLLMTDEGSPMFFFFC